MALVALEIPKVGLVMQNARLLRWLKHVGDMVSAGEPLLELETEKAVVEIEATVSGRLAEILIQVDEQASVGDRVAWIDNGEAGTASPVPVAQTASAVQATPSKPALQASSARAVAKTGAGERTRASPVARRLAAEQGIDLATITGSGPRGRIQLDDVRRASAAKVTPAQQGAVPAQPLSTMRRALARAMTLSNATIPQFSVERAFDCTALQAARTEFSARLPKGTPKLSVNDFMIQAVARTLMEFPALNATFSGNPDSPQARIVPANGAHIGLVVAVDNGLLVPVFHNVERLGIAELARRRSDCVERGLKGRLKLEELDGATFSISNLGAQGPDRFTAIINPPQSAILAVGRQRDCVVARNRGIHVRPMSELTLTVDHRLADGRLASEYLARLVQILEGGDWRLE